MLMNSARCWQSAPNRYVQSVLKLGFWNFFCLLKIYVALENLIFLRILRLFVVVIRLLIVCNLEIVAVLRELV